MYAVETAKMSSKGQLVIPDSFRKQYGWKPGMPLLMIGTDNAIVLQALTLPSDEEVNQVVTETRTIKESVTKRVKNAEAALAKLGRLGISMPVGIEKGEARRAKLMEKYS